MTGDPAVLAAQIHDLTQTQKALKEQETVLRDQLKSILLGEATEAPPGGWVYGPVTVHFVKGGERASINRKKLVLQGVSLEQILKATDFTKTKPTIKVMATGEKVGEGGDGA